MVPADPSLVGILVLLCSSSRNQNPERRKGNFNSAVQRSEDRKMQSPRNEERSFPKLSEIDFK